MTEDLKALKQHLIDQLDASGRHSIYYGPWRAPELAEGIVEVYRSRTGHDLVLQYHTRVNGAYFVSVLSNVYERWGPVFLRRVRSHTIPTATHHDVDAQKRHRPIVSPDNEPTGVPMPDHLRQSYKRRYRQRCEDKRERAEERAAIIAADRPQSADLTPLVTPEKIEAAKQAIRQRKERECQS